MLVGPSGLLEQVLHLPLYLYFNTIACASAFHIIIANDGGLEQWYCGVVL